MKYNYLFGMYFLPQYIVPIVTVSGLSVVFRSVMQGTDINVASSVIPPESVTTASECFTSINSSRACGSTRIRFSGSLLLFKNCFSSLDELEKLWEYFYSFAIFSRIDKKFL